MADPAALLERIHPEDQEFVQEAYQQIIQGSHQNTIEFRLQQADQSMG